MLQLCEIQHCIAMKQNMICGRDFGANNRCDGEAKIILW